MFRLLALLCVALSVSNLDSLGAPSTIEKTITPKIEAAIERGEMPGCVVAIGSRDRFFLKAFGEREAGVPMSKDTIFDLASLTKPLATAGLIHQLAEKEKLNLDDPIAKHLPGFDQGRPKKSEVTIRHLLLHTSGLAPANAMSEFKDGPDAAMRNMIGAKLRNPPGTYAYSDIGYMLLGEIAERVSGKPLKQLASEWLFTPLDLPDTGYLPAAEKRERCAPTEKRNGAWMRGEVHDPRAFALDGTAGHAGLFSTASDLSLYAKMLLNGGSLNGVRLFEPETVAAMTKPVRVRKTPERLRTLGWHAGHANNRGEAFSKSAYGHGGFTGTALWIDPDTKLFVIFLSSRLHPDGKGSVNGLIGEITELAHQTALEKEPVYIQPIGFHRFGEEVVLTEEQIKEARKRNPILGREIFIAFKDQLFPDGTAFERFQREKAGIPRRELRKQVVRSLKARSERDGGAFETELPKGFQLYMRTWLVNGVWGRVESEAVVEEIAKRPEVQGIYRLERRGRNNNRPASPELAKERITEETFEVGDRALGVGLDMIKASATWKRGITGKGTLAVVIDSGVHPGSPDLQDAMWRNEKDPPNGRDDDGNGYVDDTFGLNAIRSNGDVVPVRNPRNDSSHGTIAAGLIAGRGRSGRITGVAPRSRVMACVNNSILCIESLQYALEHDTDIASMSFMAEQPYAIRKVWRMQAEHATAAGLFLCGGAGNYAERPGYQDKPQIWIPKNIPCVMAGAGLTDQGTRASFSSLGPVSWAKVPGYGEELVRKPDVSACAKEIHMVRFSKGPIRRGASGNSFSGPQIAGCAALMFEANPDLHPWTAMEIIRKTSVDIGEPGWDPKFGFGRLDCEAAVRRVQAK